MMRIMDRLHRNQGMIISIIVAICICGLLVWKNYKSADFLQAKAIDIVTILLGAVIAFYLTEKLNDKRRRNDCIEHIIAEIEMFVSDEKNFIVDKSTYMKHGSCGNRIKYLKDASFKDIKDEVDFIDANFNEIRDLYSNHNKDEATLETVRVDINKHRDNIIDKCCKIRINLYK